MAVCLVTGGNYHYSGICDASAITHYIYYTTIVPYAGKRVKQYVQILFLFCMHAVIIRS